MATNDEGVSHKLFGLLHLPRHATFKVKLTMHDVNNIPFQNGAFALKWRFKNARSNSGQQGSRPSTPTESLSQASGVLKVQNGSIADPEADGGRASVDEEGRLQFSTLDKGKGKATDPDPISVNVEPPTPVGGAHGITSSPTSSLSNGKYGPYLTPEDSPRVPPNSVAPPTVVSSNPQSVALTRAPSVRVDDTSQKGITDYVPLKEHTCRWEHTVEVTVHLKIKRETNELMPCELKLILQEQYAPSVTNSSVDTVSPTRFGLLSLNLAEYADRGPVTRRYLLNESRTNATLKLTIDLAHISGERHYVVPDLQKGQPVANVAGVLGSDRLRPFVNYPDRSTSYISSANSSPRSTTPQTDGRPRPPLQHAKSSISSNSSFQKFVSDQTQHSAEAVIEAIFNPVPTTSPRISPFTYYDPASTRRPTPAKSPRPTSATGSSVDERGQRMTPPTATSLGSDDESHDAASINHSIRSAGNDSLKPPSISAQSGPSAADHLQAPNGSGGWWRRLHLHPGNSSSSAPRASSTVSSRPSSASGESTNGARRRLISLTSQAPSTWVDVASYSTTTTPLS